MPFVICYLSFLFVILIFVICYLLFVIHLRQPDSHVAGGANLKTVIFQNSWLAIALILINVEMLKICQDVKKSDHFGQ